MISQELMKVPTDSVRQTYLHILFANYERAIHSWILVFNANEVKITQEFVFMRKKPCAEMESEFDV